MPEKILDQKMQVGMHAVLIRSVAQILDLPLDPDEHCYVLAMVLPIED